MCIKSSIKQVYQNCQKTVRKQRSRRMLMTLDHAALKDIGISRVEALEEGRKKFWQ